MSDPNYITPRGLDRLRREIEWLEQEERPKIVAEVEYAASLGDRSENAEYIYGKKRLRRIDSRRRFLIGRLEKVRLVDPTLVARKDRVAMGATVVLADEDGNEKTWRIYGEDEVDIENGVLSWKSPIALAILGKEEGDAVTFKTPGGKREVEIVSVRYEAVEPLPEKLDFQL